MAEELVADMGSISTVQWFLREDRTLASKPIAVEVCVEVSGTHAAPGGAGKRELFSESTKTTLVFEDGAVVGLSAAVEVGQLLFLKHLESHKEIVARVLRQRSFGSASAYVELEFTEAAPGFWGGLAEGSETGAAEFLADDAADEKMHVPEDPAGDLEGAPSRDERAGLGMQISSLLETSSHSHSVEKSAPMRAAVDVASEVEPVAVSSVKAAPVEVAQVDVSPVARKLLELVPSLPQPTAVDSLKLPSGGEEVATESEAEGADADAPEVADMGVEAPVRGRAIPHWMIAAAAVIFAVVAGSAYYEGFLRNLYGKWRLTADAVTAISSSHEASNVPARRVAAKAIGTSGIINVSSSRAVDSESTSMGGNVESGSTNDSARASEHNAGLNGRSGDTSRTSDEVGSRENKTRAENHGNRSPAVALKSSTSGAVSASEVADDIYEPPNLLKSVSAVPPPESVQEFVTGDVKFDALVDATGRVASVEVISGPSALRAAALDAVRHYQYKPANKNGRSVPAHVPVTIKFWYEP